MAKQKKEVHKVTMTEGKRAIIQQLFQEYDIESANDIQEALNDLLSGIIIENLIYKVLFTHSMGPTTVGLLIICHINVYGNDTVSFRSWIQFQQSFFRLVQLGL